MDFIVRETCSEIRALARLSLKNNWNRAAGAMALFYILMTTLPLAVSCLIPGATYTIDDPNMGEVPLPILYGLYVALLSGAFELGLYSYFIHFVRKRDIHAAHIFDGFQHIFKALLLTITVTFFIFLWSLLFVIPGIIAALRYSQSFIVLADHPEYSVGQCIGVSKQYMKQNKGKFFCLGLSFIGWLILSSLLPAIVPTSLSTIVYLLVDLAANVPSFFVMAYMGASEVIFYELVSKNLMAAPRTETGETSASVAELSTDETSRDEFDF